MQRTPVSSNNLRSVGYDLETQTLEISFKSGGIYQYYYVPENIYQSLMTAVSKGKYFAAYIKNKYRHRRI
jgi:hypothetical protein